MKKRNLGALEFGHGIKNITFLCNDGIAPTTIKCPFSVRNDNYECKFCRMTGFGEFRCHNKEARKDLVLKFVEESKKVLKDK